MLKFDNCYINITIVGTLLISTTTEIQIKKTEVCYKLVTGASIAFLWLMPMNNKCRNYIVVALNCLKYLFNQILPFCNLLQTLLDSNRKYAVMVVTMTQMESIIALNHRIFSVLCIAQRPLQLALKTYIFMNFYFSFFYYNAQIPMKQFSA